MASSGSASTRSMGMRKLLCRTSRRVAVVGALVMGVATLALADGALDHERARAAMLAGEIRPLAEILQRVHPQLEGEMIAVELEHENDRWTYEIKLLQPDGRIVEWYVDARDATVLQRKTKLPKSRQSNR